jgi:predicted Ser/Thr protein kinase
MSLCKRIFFFISIAIASVQSRFLEQNLYRFPNARVVATQSYGNAQSFRVVVNDGEQKAVKYVFLESTTPEARPSLFVEQPPINLPPLSAGDWDEIHIQLDRHTGAHISNTSRTNHPGMMDTWHPRKIDYLEFVNVDTIQHDRLQVVTHSDFEVPVLIKIASFPWEISSLEPEVKMYRLLHGSGTTPEFLGHVTEGGRVMGFITEYIEEMPLMKGRNKQGCLTTLHRVHHRGIVHGDAHDGNCMIRKNGSSVMIDFELSQETGSHEEFERDLDIMGRCIQTLSEHS